MGSRSRFRLFASLIASKVGPQSVIADVAGGKGGLRGALHLIGYRNVITIDKRRCQARGRGEYRLFDYRTEPDKYDLIVGMHPDQATDHIIMFAGEKRRPAMVCPCCITPSAAPYGGGCWSYFGWLQHLKGLAKSMELKVEHIRLPMEGRSDVLILTPRNS